MTLHCITSGLVSRQSLQCHARQCHLTQLLPLRAALAKVQLRCCTLVPPYFLEAEKCDVGDRYFSINDLQTGESRTQSLLEMTSLDHAFSGVGGEFFQGHRLEVYLTDHDLSFRIG